MNKLTHLATILTMASMLVACQDDSKTETKEPEAAKSLTKTFTLAAPQLNDFSVADIDAPTSPPINTSRDTVSFITKISAEFKIASPSTSHSIHSDEYWTKVSGAELNSGVALTISQASSVIRISPRADTSSGALIHSKAISPENIQLLKQNDKTSNTKAKSYIKSLADPQALATAGLTDDSSALLLSADAKAGKYRLRVNEKLQPNASYMINVKEKNSPYQLKLTSKNAVSSTQTSIPFELELTNSKTVLKPSASLKHADGSFQALKVEQINGQWQAKLPVVNAMPSNNLGLSEIQLQVSTQVAGKAVVRTVKKAFKQFVPSAKIQPQITSQWLNGLPESLTVALDMSQAGRFSVAGYLTGVDQLGIDRPILKTESASWLTPNSTEITLKLDAELIVKSGLNPPYKLQGLTLKDQGQMARLSYQAHGLTLN
ncbi:DUF4785 family protein [Shewanella sp. D64]|uniref:DUF4785 domain-containing protein n=1 Tax=unclassified Shewanella TaxID=196818 RepID=UPI0022BA5A55|nr:MULTISPECIES: DUF4785 domain-containing protein [unclassified Shewanella]MEC4728961.1 DUF4785 family protein [Shewanella sp. D64]MEC4740808.1 DUF4785 family protein [Shewanella sp. E94]WBJ96690.1 DUF4785 family protein [Shewanella sp. MTB7]